MPRGFRRDNAATNIARGLGELRDKRSFISLPKQTHGELQGHKILYGADKSAMRVYLFQVNWAQNNGIGRCENCGRHVTEVSGEWHHLRSKAGERCDCVPGNGAVFCHLCHHDAHVQVKFGIDV